MNPFFSSTALSSSRSSRYNEMPLEQKNVNSKDGWGGSWRLGGPHTAVIIFLLAILVFVNAPSKLQEEAEVVLIRHVVVAAKGTQHPLLVHGHLVLR